MDKLEFLFEKKHQLFFNFIDHTTQDKNAVEYINRTLATHFHGRPKSDISLLDIGCGYGIKTIPIIGQLENYGVVHTVALDPSEELLDYFKQSISNEDVKFVNDTWEGNTPDEDYDCILSIHTFYYIQDWKESLTKMVDNLTQNGVLCLSLRSKGDVYRFKDYFLPKLNDEYSSERHHEEVCSTLDKLEIKYRAEIVESKLDISDCLQLNDKGKMLIEFMLRKPYGEIPQPVREEIQTYLTKNSTDGTLTHKDGFIWIQKK
jgi:SAM-dependent methyltransferase